LESFNRHIGTPEKPQQQTQSNRRFFGAEE
jgi:hypothetical protein